MRTRGGGGDGVRMVVGIEVRRAQCLYVARHLVEIDAATGQWRGAHNDDFREILGLRGAGVRICSGG